MSAELISGKDLATNIKKDLAVEVEELKKQGVTPHLTVVLVGHDPASESYVKGKEKACAETGMGSNVIRLDETISEDELIQTVDKLNKDDAVHGILVQLPLPDHIDEQKIIDLIDPEKDVDGFHPVNIGRLVTEQEGMVSCTPLGIMEMLDSKNIEIQGKNAVVVGASNIVGKPVAQLLLNRGATITNCHIYTEDLKAHTKMADILVVAVGKAHLITADHVKEGAAVIDVGINRLEDGSMTGDVDFENVKEKASYISPVPGGVGPMTITILLKNTIIACKRQENVE